MELQQRLRSRASQFAQAEALMIAHGFAVGQMNVFVCAGLATATAERAVGPLIIW
jgi:hypothetical protein